MNSHQSTLIFVVLVCCWGGVGRIVWANIVDRRYYGPHRHRIGGGYLYGTGAYHRGLQQYQNTGLIGRSVGGFRPSLAQMLAAVAMSRHNYYNHGNRPYENVIIPMSPYYWSATARSGPRGGIDHYRGRGSATAIGRNQQQLPFGGLIPQKPRKMVIDGPGAHVSQSLNPINCIGLNTGYGGVYC